VGRLETSGTGNEANDLPSEIWLVDGLFSSASKIYSGQNASCVSPVQSKIGNGVSIAVFTICMIGAIFKPTFLFGNSPFEPFQKLA
jgi:hypothetical protein